MSSNKPELRDYQKVAVAFLRANPRSALFLDMKPGPRKDSRNSHSPHS